MRLLFVTNFCPHYRVRTFEELARRIDVEFVFFSAGDEWYWEQRHGRQAGRFPHEYLRGFQVTPWMRVTPKLLRILWRYDGDVILKCITGRFALPVSLLIAKLRKRPFVLWTGIWAHPRTPFHRLTYPITRLVYGLADAIAVYGEHVKRYLVSIGVDEAKIFIAPHAVDNEMYNRSVSLEERDALRERLGLAGRRVVLHVGRLEAVKGVDQLVRAFARSAPADATLVLAGEGSLRDTLEAQAQALGIANRVLFAGYVSPADTVPLYAIAEVLVLASVGVREGRELWGLVVNEAMNQSCPVIATMAVGAAAGGLVRHGVNGEVIPEGDVGALGGALQRVLSDAGYRAALRAGARRTIETWDNSRMVDGFIAAARYARARRART